MDPKALMLKLIVDVVIQMATPELIRDFADKAIDFLKKRIRESSNEVDDKFLPLLESIESTFGLDPD